MTLSKNGLHKFSATTPLNELTYNIYLEDEKTKLDGMSPEALKQTIEGYQQSIEAAFKNLRDRTEDLMDDYVPIRILQICLDYAQEKLESTGGRLPLKIKVMHPQH